MPDLKQLTRQKPTTATIDLGDGDTVNLVFDANRVTPRWMNQTMVGANETDLLVLAKALEEVLISWDVTDDGQEWLPTTDHISQLSFPVVNMLFQQVCESAAPGEAEGNASSVSVSGPPTATSGQGSPTSPNGSDSSTSQTSLESAPSR